MPVSIFSGCDDSCGWVAASIAALPLDRTAFQSSGLCQVWDVDPLVLQVSISSHRTGVRWVDFLLFSLHAPGLIHLQSYKTFVFFLSRQLAGAITG